VLIYPAIDVKGGACVRLLDGRSEAGVLRYPHAPAAVAEAVRAAGVGRLHVVDMEGAESGAPGRQAEIAALGEKLFLQVGGGVRSGADVARWLDAGAGRVVVGAAAITRPEAVSDWIQVFGPEQIAAALDVRTVAGVPRVGSLTVASETGPTLWEALERLRFAGLKHVVVSDRDREGRLGGPNLALLAAVRARRPDLSVQYGGGVRSAADVAALKAGGAAGAVIGRAFMDGALNLKDALAAAG